MHEPVLAQEVVTFLSPSVDGLYVDCSVGLGGHTQLLLEAGAGRVIAIDRDTSALEQARARIGGNETRVEFVHENVGSDAIALGKVGNSGLPGVRLSVTRPLRPPTPPLTMVKIGCCCVNEPKMVPLSLMRP